MASLYKKTITKIDPATGRKRKCKSKKWWGRYRAANRKVVRVPLARDKSAAQFMLNALVTKAENEAAGRIDPFEAHRKRPLVCWECECTGKRIKDEKTCDICADSATAAHLSDFRKYLADKGNTTDHVDTTTQRVRDVLTGCKFKVIADLSASRLQGFLADLRAGGRALATGNDKLSKRPGSVATCNHVLRACKMFTRWLVKDRRSPDNVLAHLEYQNTEPDRKRVRRPLSADDLAKLILTTAAGPEVQGLSGADRAALYVLATNTGFRRNEIGSLLLGSFDFEADPPSVTIEAGYSKNGRRDVLPLKADAAAYLQVWIATKGTLNETKPLFDVRDKRTAEILRTDLEAAGLPYCIDDNQFTDFHSLRGTYISGLARGGVSLTVAQKLARHSDPRLTANVYTVLGVHDQAAAVELLPSVAPANAPQTEPAVLRATGTDNATANDSVVSSVVPSGAQNGALRVSSQESFVSSNCTESTTTDIQSGNEITPDGIEGYCSEPPHIASVCIEVPEVGLEPTHGCPYWILSPARLPFRHSGFEHIEGRTTD